MEVGPSPRAQTHDRMARRECFRIILSSSAELDMEVANFCVAGIPSHSGPRQHRRGLYGNSGSCLRSWLWLPSLSFSTTTHQIQQMRALRGQLYGTASSRAACAQSAAQFDYHVFFKLFDRKFCISNFSITSRVVEDTAISNFVALA